MNVEKISYCMKYVKVNIYDWVHTEGWMFHASTTGGRMHKTVYKLRFKQSQLFCVAFIFENILEGRLIINQSNWDPTIQKENHHQSKNPGWRYENENIRNPKIHPHKKYDTVNVL